MLQLVRLGPMHATANYDHVSLIGDHDEPVDVCETGQALELFPTSSSAEITAA